MNQNTGNCCPMNDQEKMEDLIAQEKYLMYTYSAFLPEATCPQLRQVLRDNFNDCASNQQAVFDQMNRMGWYPVENAPVDQVNQARQKFAQMKGQLG